LGDWIDRDGKLIFLEKTIRTVPYGFLGVIFGVYLAQLGFTPVAIGIVLTGTVLRSAVFTLVISFIADRIGRRKTLVFFALTDFVAGTLLFVSKDWWGPVLAGIVGNMTVGAGEVGPFLSLETAILPRTARPDCRTLTFSVYNLVGYGASAAGALLAGLPNAIGYSPLFLGYMISGLLGAALYSNLSSRVEPHPGAARRSPLSPRGMSIVDERDRTAAAGLTSATRTVSSSVSPSLAGYALANLWLGTPLVAAGVLKLAYDLLIYRSFRRVRPPEEREVKAS